MGIERVTGAFTPAGATPVEPKQSFSKLMQEAKAKEATPAAAPSPPQVERSAPVETAGHLLGQVADAQGRLDRVMTLAQSGKTFTPAELLGLQAQVYSASQELDLAGKVVEKATGGVKQVLQTQV
jgi:hypothetical protein